MHYTALNVYLSQLLAQLWVLPPDCYLLIPQLIDFYETPPLLCQEQVSTPWVCKVQLWDSAWGDAVLAMCIISAR